MTLRRDGISPVEQWGTAEDGYHFSEDMTDKAIAWLRSIHTMTPDKPFFHYLPYGATHAPHHVAPEWFGTSPLRVTLP